MKNKRLTASIAGLFVFGGLCLINNASALVGNGELDDNGILVSANRSLELTATIDAESLYFDITSSDLQTKTLTVAVQTNNATGYSVNMNDAMGFDYLTNKAMPTVGKINNISGTFAATDFPVTGWGYTTDTENLIFSAIPTISTKIASTSTYGSINIPIIVGVRAGDEIPAGTYENKLLFTVVANPSLRPSCNESATTIENAVCMQDINEDVKDSMIVERQYQLYDARDGRLYYVMKNTMGFVWMTQNLDFDLDSETTLTYLDTNLEDGMVYTPLDSTVRRGEMIKASNEHYASSPVVSYDLGEYHMDYNKFKEYDGPECTDVTTCEYFSPGSGTHTDVGNLYTPAAAVLAYSSQDDNYKTIYPVDICPRGWQIPTDFLGSLMDVNTERDGIYSKDLEPYDTEVSELLQAPYHFTYSEYHNTEDFDGSSMIIGRYMSKDFSTYSSQVFGSVFGFTTDEIYYDKYMGNGTITYELMSVRCVAK